MSLVIKQTRVVEVPVQSISVAATCQQAMLIDAAGQCVGSTNAMPAFMPTLLEIDLATGQIKNWCVPTGEQLQAIADGQSAAVAPTPLTELMQQSKPVEIEPIKTDDEPTDADTVLCPDVPDSFYAVPTPCPMPDIEQPESVAPVEAVTAESVQREQFAEFLAQRGIEPNAPKPTNQITVHYDHLAEKWHAETNDHQATSTIGKFEAIKNVLKKANLHGVYEINRIEDELYSHDGSRTLNADTVYMTQGTDGAWSARMPNNRHVSAVIGIDGALTGLLKEMEGIQPEDAVIIETTDDEMRSRNKRRYAVTSRHEYVNTPDSMFNALQMVNLGFNLDLCDGLACIAAGLVKLTPGKSEKDIDGQTMAVLQLTEKGDELWSTLGRSDLNQDAADDVLRAYLLKDPHFDQLSRAVESCKTSIGIRCLEMHIKSIHDKQMQAALWDTINRRKHYLLDTTAA